MDPTYPLVPIVNFIACALVIIPLIHMVTRSWNTGVFVYAFWTFLSCLSLAINSIVWRNDVKDRAPVFCDITSHLQILVNIGRPACTLIITRRLYAITRLQNAMVSKRQKRVELSLELALSMGFPFVIAGLYYVVQGARYEILEELGCSPTSATSGVSLILFSSWEMIFSMTSLVFYSPRIIYVLYRYRREMNEYLTSRDEGLSQSHMSRVLALGCFDAFITLPVGVATLVVNILRQVPFKFYEGWTFIHTDWEPVFFTKSKWSTTKFGTFIVHWDEWLNPFLALVFFALFGLTSEAKEGYRRLFQFLGGHFGAKPGASTENALPEAVFKSRGETDMTSLSNTSSITRLDVMA